MSENNKEITVHDQLTNQLNQFIYQRDQAQINLQQLIGAIYATEMAIKKTEESNNIPSYVEQLVD